jgi:hypothetical protein
MLVGSTNPVAAQTTAEPTFELGAAYQWLHVTGDEGDSFPFGLAVDAARYWGPLGLAIEGGWSRDSAEVPAIGEVPGVSVSSNWFHAGAGPRFAVRTPGAFRPYVQVLLGFSTIRSSVDITGVGEDSDSTTAFMIQPSGGVTMVLGDGWGLFGDIGYRRSFFDTGSNEVRVLFGARMILD